MGLLRLSILAAILAHSVICQENAGTNIAPKLEECYNTTKLVTRQYRLPATINTLIELVRKIEDGSTYQDARELSYQILHRFRQDGIRRTMKTVDESLGIIPYSPKGWEAFKNRVQLKKLTPGSAQSFNNQSLNSLESCSLHFMISSSIESQERGDEGSVCNKLSQYTQRLHKRNTELAEQLDSTLTRTRSSCPIESGVVYTKWGAVKAGLVMAGIASGFQNNPITTRNGTISSRYASTLVGELSEVALSQPSSDKIIGNSGGWNSTLVPRYYFLQNSESANLFLTDAEIRGGIDGLYIALNIENWKSKYSNIKISQILDMYYSRGVFNTSARACNRKALMNNLLQDDVLLKQTTLFNDLLDDESQYSYTPNRANFPLMAEKATQNFQTYFRNNLNDLQCSAENDVVERVATDVLIFIDTNWNFRIMEAFIGYILDNIDVNKFDSSYTIFDGNMGNVIINKSRSIVDFYEMYNLTEHQKYVTGFNYIRVIEKVEDIMKAKLNNETDLTGQSTIVLMVPHNTPSSSDSNYFANKKNNVYKRILPDMRILVAGSGSKASYNDLVTSPNNDIFVLNDNPDETSIRNTALEALKRFKSIPRAVVNPQCGSAFNRASTTFELVQYVEPTGVNYHRISPNYFVNGQYLKIQGQGYGTLTVCSSRTETNPRVNGTGVNCQNINSDEKQIKLDDYCTEDVIDCAPIYLSVEGVNSPSFRCTDKQCRFPDGIKYTIRLENVDCSSGSQKLFSSFVVVSLLFALMRF